MTGPRWSRVVLAGVMLAGAIVGGSAAVPASAAPAALRKWQIVPSPHPAEGYSLSGVSCTTATSCVAVGSIADGTTFHSLIETWDGSHWTVATPANVGTLTDILTGVACVDASHCVAVGEYLPGSVDQTLVETWDGTSWTVTPSPNTGVGDVLSKISCVSATDCVAVGWYSDGTRPRALLEMWNGVEWSIAAITRARHTPTSVLNGVSCTSATSCVAVGSAGSSDTGTAPLVEKWNGTRWLRRATPTLESGDNELDDVACSNSNHCAAVGHSGDLNGPLIEMWDGTSWTVADRPNPGVGGNQLNAVACPSRTKCVAVGSYDAGQPDRHSRNLVEAWDGATWSVVASASHFHDVDTPLGVSCSSGTICTAVGTTYVSPNQNGYVLTGPA